MVSENIKEAILSFIVFIGIFGTIITLLGYKITEPEGDEEERSDMNLVFLVLFIICATMLGIFFIYEFLIPHHYTVKNKFAGY